MIRRLASRLALVAAAAAFVAAAGRRAAARANPRYCSDCRKPIIPSLALCAECFEICTNQRRKDEIARGEA